MLLIDILHGEKTSSVPFWFMRQAGRYLPEYKKVRANFPNFLSFCYTPEAACEVTLQPITRFGMSAAIIFSDILVIPDALGQDVSFKENIGPVLVPFTTSDIENISKDKFRETLDPVYQAIRLTRSNLTKDKALIGFCGAPWTLACYMLQGKGSRDFAVARSFANTEKSSFAHLLAALVDAVAEHACAQIDAGANVIQLFDSWSGVLSESEFEQYVILPTQKIVAIIKEKYPHIPVIGFPRMCGAKLRDYAQKTRVDAVSMDGSVTHAYAKSEVQKYAVLQGNLDSQMLAEDRESALRETKKLLENFTGTPFIFNLAHGILPHTPIANVQAVCDVIKNHA